MKIARLALLLLLGCAPAASAADSIQPGDPIHQGCTLAWVFDASDGRTFFASASHCFDKVGEPVHLSVPGLPEAQQGERLGTVRARGENFDESAANDVALIEVDAAMRPRVMAEMRGHPTIPSGIATAADVAPGDLLQLSGWGMGFEASAPTRESRQARLNLAEPLLWQGLAPVTGGDSGGPVAHAATGAAFGLVKGHGCRNGSSGSYCPPSHGPTVAAVFAIAKAAGIDLRLRRAGELAPALAPATQPRHAAPQPQPQSAPAPAPAAQTAPQPASQPKAKPKPKKARRCRSRGAHRRSARGRKAPRCARSTPRSRR
jgi:pyruvate/2-oxoglutarate dehydrogenase complex dihydrolipoamide acyltransferase (E2) component